MFITFCLNFNVMNTTMSTQKIYITSSAVKFKFKAINRIRRFCNKGILFLITFIVFCFVFTFFLLLIPSWWIYQLNVNYSSKIKKSISCYLAHVETDYLSVTMVLSSKWSNDNTQKKTPHIFCFLPTASTVIGSVSIYG